MLNLHRDKKIVRREPGRDEKILCDHRQDGNDEVHRLEVTLIYIYIVYIYKITNPRPRATHRLENRPTQPTDRRAP